MQRLMLFIMLVLVLAAAIAGCAAGQEPNQADPQQPAANSDSQGAINPDLYFRTDDGEGGITVGAVWGAPEYFQAAGNRETISALDLENNLVFEISMDTHSGDLRDYPMEEQAELVVDGKIYAPVQWQLLGADSHHPSGVLTFPAKDAAGEAVVAKDSKIELVIKDLGEVDTRVLVWQLPLAQ